MSRGRATTVRLAQVLTMLLVATLAWPGPVDSASADAGEPLRVLIVGDSVTQGSAGDVTWRYRLWQHLTADGTAVDYVGPRDDLWDDIARRAGSQDYVDPAFDRDHASRWGQTLTFLGTPDQIGAIGDLVTAYRPDVVIEMLGVNDLTYLMHSAEEVVAGIDTFVDDAREADPGVDVVLGHLSQTWYAQVPEFNRRLDDLAVALDDDASRVTTAAVDLGYAEREDTWDPAHPNAQGEVLIAAAMADALAGLGLTQAYPRPLPQVPLGPRFGAELAAVPIDGGASLTWQGPPGADREVVELRDVSEGGAWAATGEPVTGTSTTLTGLTNGHTYALRLRPVKGYWPAAPDVPLGVVRVRPLPPPPGVVRLTRTWSPRTDRVRVLARAAAGATSYRLDVAPARSCSAPVRFTRHVGGLATPRATFRTPAAFVRVRMLARNLAGDGPVGPTSRCLRVR